MKIMDKLLIAATTVLFVMAEYQEIYKGTFEPVDLASAIAILWGIRSANEHAPRMINAKWPVRSQTVAVTSESDGSGSATTTTTKIP